MRTITNLLAALSLCGLLAAQGNQPQFEPGQILIQERAGVEPADIHAALARLNAKLLRDIPQINHHVIAVPPDQVDGMIRALLQTGLFSVAERNGLAYTSTIPNDPSFALQWHLATIHAATAWTTTKGSTQPIAIIDSGAYAGHPDLSGRIGPGWNFLSGNSNTADIQGHGTAVTGVVGAKTNNLIGIAGLTWTNPIMPLVVVNSSNYATYADIASAITYAADHGSRIINISIAGATSSSTLQNAVNYAWNKGAVVFAAAGNNSSSTPMYPANCTNVIAVAATTSTNTLASFSNYGSWIDLSAPGNNILTTDSSGGYGYWWGTSLATPVAAGVGALVLAAKPTLSASGMVSILESNTTYIGSSSIFGHGLVDAGKAVAAAVAATTVVPAVSITTPAAGGSVSGTINVTGTASDSLGISSVTLLCDGLLVSTTVNKLFSIPWNTASVASGTHTLTVKAVDPSGNTGSASVNVTVPVRTLSTADTTAPTVSITSPANGTHLLSNGALTVSASAHDNIGVVQVSIFVDGVQQYTGTSAPYSFQWNPNKAVYGAHTISATAWDAAGNHATASITVYK
jgi:thermitase